MSWLWLFLFPSLLPSLHSTPMELPPAPYVIKLRCLAGASRQVLMSCPSSSTTCGFLAPLDDYSEGIFDCIDESLLLPSRLSPPGSSQLARVCGAGPACVSLPPHSVDEDAAIRLAVDPSAPLRLCCSLYHSLLSKIALDSSFLPPSAPLISCGGQECERGAIGCLVHSRLEKNEKEESVEYGERRRRRRRKTEEWEGVRAVDVSFPADTDEEFLGDSDEEQYFEVEDGEEEEEMLAEETTHCVFRHVHDELYKYCMLVHSKPDTLLKCTTHQGFAICCCFVPPGGSTCDPLKIQRSIVAQSTLPPKRMESTTTSSSTTTTSTTTSSPPSTLATHPLTTTAPRIRKIKTERKTTTTTQASPTSTDRCKIVYEKGSGGRRRARLLCSSATSSFSSIFASFLIIHYFISYPFV